MAMAACTFALSFLCMLVFVQANGAASPQPQPWPLQFHSLLYINASSSLQMVHLWYDWPNGRNFNIIQHQLGSLLYDLEWTNGTSFYYDLQAKTCRTVTFEVGILRPNWLEGATYLGVEQVDGFTCNVWSKADFIKYWEDIKTKRPVHWLFSTGRAVHVMTFEVGAVLEDSKWQAPVYCFSEKITQGFNPLAMPGTNGGSPKSTVDSAHLWVKKMRDIWKSQWTRWLHNMDS